MPVRKTEALIAEMSNVQRLVHLAYRRDPVDEEELRIRLLREMRTAYENELEIQAARLGCPGRRANLRSGAILSELNELCAQDAASIVRTFNRDLGFAIIAIRERKPKANRHVYAKELLSWEEKRGKWKNPQILGYAHGRARSLAQAHFVEHNRPQGYAILQPRTAVCPVCVGWIARRWVPLEVAAREPPPYHPNCYHVFNTSYQAFVKEECALLWMGE